MIMNSDTQPNDSFANIPDPEEGFTSEIGPFLAYDGDSLPLLAELTQLYARVQKRIAALKPARSRLGQLKGTLLDNQLDQKYPDPKPDHASDRHNDYQRDFWKAY